MLLLSRLTRGLVFWFLFAYAVTWLAHFAYAVLPNGEAFRERRGFALQHVLKASRPLVQAGRTRELVRYLEDGLATGLVDYYSLQEKDRTETGGHPPARRPVLTEPLSETDGWVWGRADGNELSLQLASGYGLRTRVEQAWQEERTRVPFEGAFLLFAAALGLWFQRNARRSAAAGAVEAPRREARRLKAVRAEQARVRFAGDTGEFAGVCGRSAILDQSAHLAAGEAGKFFAAVEEFYSDCAALLGRYRGRLHGVHGHELVFYFAEKDPGVDARLAISAARDLAEVAARRGFRIGTAIAAGRLHGVHLLSGYALFGDPVEETSDLVKALSSLEKEGGVWMNEAVARMVASHVELRSARKHSAKALVSTSSTGLALERARTSGAFTELAYHRGDGALADIMQSLERDPSWDREHFVGALSELQRVPARRCGPAVVDAYRALLVAELGRKDPYRLSSVVALAAALLSRSLVDRPMERLLLEAVAVKDRRVRANAVELFTRFFPEREIPELKSLIRDEDNRVSANALIKAACERFDERVISRLDERLRGGSVANVASALHAMGEIALYYRRHDPLFLGTKHNFMRLFDGVPDWANHPNTMIRRQALLAAHKLRSEGLDARLRELFSTCQDPELLGLFGSTYGWKKEAAEETAA